MEKSARRWLSDETISIRCIGSPTGGSTAECHRRLYEHGSASWRWRSFSTVASSAAGAWSGAPRLCRSAAAAPVVAGPGNLVAGAAGERAGGRHLFFRLSPSAGRAREGLAGRQCQHLSLVAAAGTVDVKYGHRVFSPQWLSCPQERKARIAGSNRQWLPPGC